MAKSIKCWHAWNAICTSSRGSVKPCCVYDTQKDEPLFTGNFTESANLPHMKRIREQLSAGRWPKGCNDCANDEYVHAPSMRTRDLDKPSKNSYNSTSVDTVSYADLKFGNACNLMCYTCGPHSSSMIAKEFKRWRSDFKELEHSGFNDVAEEHRSVAHWKHNWHTDMQIDADGLETVKFTGGEPFKNSTVRRTLLEFIAKGRTDLHLEFVSNLIGVGNEWWHLLDQFASVSIVASCDAVGRLYEYIRHPAHYVEFCENFWDRYNYSNYNMSIAVTVSALNVMYLPSLIEEFPDVNMNFDNMVYRPSWYDPRHMPKEAIDIAVARCTPYPQLAGVVRQLKNARFDEWAWTRLMRDTAVKDSVRGQVLRWVAPEIMEISDAYPNAV